ncbi:MAG: hypothetical protein A2X49_02600 [Lentisphaerae bacterium GWF2_52_8]|nr:MAG: hypothetical protein A2X49_02600 [Lentisphaerae bacterium GWF2_52_8]
MLYMRLVEPHWFKIKRQELASEKWRCKKALKILHLSDFHAMGPMPYSDIEKAIWRGLMEKPDIIMLTGDFITWKLIDPEKYAPLLSLLPAAAPTFACLGNHDGGAWAGSSHGYPTHEKVETLLKSSGICTLVNESVDLNLHGQKVRIIGLGDFWNRESQPEKVLKKDASLEGVFQIVLAHNPDSKELLEDFKWDLMLCGHSHGGQLYVPLLGRPFAPIKDHAFASGLIKWEGRWINVTNGVGNLHGLRLNCRPQINVIELSSKEATQSKSERMPKIGN